VGGVPAKDRYKMSNSNPLISGTAMGVLIGVALVIIPWVISWPDAIFGRIIISALGAGLIWLSLRMSKG